MTIPANALPASDHRALAASPPPRPAGTVRETAALDRVEKKPEATSAEKVEALTKINDSLKSDAIDLRFEFDKASDQMVTQVLDTQTGELIRQMPSEDAIHVAKVLGRLQGLLFSHKA